MSNGCDCTGPCEMPSWVVAGWYNNDPDGQSRAIAHWHHMRRVGWTTEAERQAARDYAKMKPRLHPCSECGQFAFFRPTTCYWCRQLGFAAIRQAMEDYRRANQDRVVR